MVIMKTPSFNPFFILCGVIIALWGAYWGVVFFIDYDKGKWNNAGTFGDMFGGFNALISGLALAGLIVTIWQQMKSLEIQQDELSATREELKKQTEQFRAQIEQNELNQKRAEIYQELERMEYLVKNIEYKDLHKDKTYIGYAALKEIFYNTAKLIDCVFPSPNADLKAHILNDIVENALNIYSKIDDVSAWMFSFANLSEKICKDFLDHPKVGSSFLSKLVKETPMTSVGLLYLYHDTILNLPVIEELRERNFISTHSLGNLVLEEERRKLFFIMIQDDSFLSAPEQTILTYANKWRKSKGMSEALMIPVQQVDVKQSQGI